MACGLFITLCTRRSLACSYTIAQALGEALRSKNLDCIDTVVADVLIGRLPFLLQRVQGVNKVEYEIFQKGLWQCGLEPTWLSQYVKQELRAAFGKLQEEEEVVFGPPPPPLSKDFYIQRIAG